MTLREFLVATSGVPAPLLRQAMTAALLVEPARDPAAYRRFYRLVLGELGRMGVPLLTRPPSTTARPSAPERPADWDSLVA